MVFGQFTSDIISDTSTCECTKHFYDTTAKQESKGSASQCSGDCQREGRVQAVNPFDLIQRGMDILTALGQFSARKTGHELFKTVELGGVDSGIGQTQ